MKQFCQSCGMPLNEEVLGTNQDGSKHQEYCMYCFEKGAFKDEMSMEQMATFCADMMVKENAELTYEKALQDNLSYFSTLKRWQK